MRSLTRQLGYWGILALCTMILGACNWQTSPSQESLETQALRFKQKLIAFDTAAEDEFGASLAMDGNFLAVGVPFDDNNNRIDDGSVYLYRRNSLGTWVLSKKLTPGDPPTSSYRKFFGSSVAISGDTIVVGARGDDYSVNNNGVINQDVGSAYIFQRNQGGANAWGEVKKLLPPISYIGSKGDEFGSSVAIKGDTVVVGAPEIFRGKGYAFVFERNQGGANAWSAVKQLRAKGGIVDDAFGTAVAIDTNTLAVKAARHDNAYDADGDGNIECSAASRLWGPECSYGSVYIFDRNQGGTNAWGHVKMLSPTAGDHFFSYASDTLALSNDTLVVGGPYTSFDLDGDGLTECNSQGLAECSAGAAYILERNQGGSNAWGLVKKLVTRDKAVFEYFGDSVSIQGDTLVIGSSQDSYDVDKDGTIECDFPGGGPECSFGSAYVFSRNQGGSNAWGQTRKLISNSGGGFASFGGSVATFGERVAIGELHNDNSGLFNNGAAYIFE